MKRIVAKKWVEALRSGKYEQGTRYLKSENKYCCLGVLCEISNISSFISNFYLSELPESYYGSRRDLPYEVGQWGDVKTPLGNIEEFDICLSEINDNEHGTFKEIADYIESVWPEL